jgi:hypothetical protein
MYAISAYTGEGCRDLMWAVQIFLEKHAAPDRPREAEAPVAGEAAA